MNNDLKQGDICIHLLHGYHVQVIDVLESNFVRCLILKDETMHTVSLFRKCNLILTKEK